MKLKSEINTHSCSLKAEQKKNCTNAEAKTANKAKQFNFN